eukprot:g45888.t1
MELTGLKEAKQLLIQQKLQLQANVESMKSKIEQEKNEHQLTKTKLSEAQAEMKKNCAELEAKLQGELKDKEAQSKQHEEAMIKLNMQITALNENMVTLKKEWQGSQRRVSELEKQTDDLHGEIAVLEATVQHNQEERRALLERCLKSESETEKLQAKVVDLRRKLDDTVAAMQELGRENQALQVSRYIVSVAATVNDMNLLELTPLAPGTDLAPCSLFPLVWQFMKFGLLEGILTDRIYMYLGRQELIRDHHHGFVFGKSCSTNLIEFFEEVTKRTDEGRAVDVVYLDFSKMFNKVPH